MTVEQTIRAKLMSAFAPSLLEIADESDRHRGHGGWREGGETHFRIVMHSTRFRGMNRVARQRAVYDVLRDDLGDEGIHALSMRLEEDEG
ncbi:MAG: BolA family protein [Pseudomonadota bacterium]